MQGLLVSDTASVFFISHPCCSQPTPCDREPWFLLVWVRRHLLASKGKACLPKQSLEREANWYELHFMVLLVPAVRYYSCCRCDQAPDRSSLIRKVYFGSLVQRRYLSVMAGTPGGKSVGQMVTLLHSQELRRDSMWGLVIKFEGSPLGTNHFL